MPLTGSYTSDVQYLIEMGENAPLANDPNATNIIVQLDSKGRPFVGYGFDLLTYASNPSQALSALKAAGAVIVDEDQFNILLPHIPTSLTFNSGLLDLLAATFYLPDQASAVALLQSSIATAETGLNALTDDLGIGTIPDSNERAALVDMYYQLPGGDGINGYFRFGDGSFTRLSLALKSGNRAEAWFQIRYGSSDHGKNGLGVVARRYVDSQLFGLYASPDAPTEAEAIQAYQMLTYHRAQIVGYEQQFGSNPYGSDPYGIPAASQIAAANRTYSLNGTANQVQTLTQIFDSAAQEEIQYLAGQYSGVLPSIQVDDTGGTNSSMWRATGFARSRIGKPLSTSRPFSAADNPNV